MPPLPVLCFALMDPHLSEKEKSIKYEKNAAHSPNRHISNAFVSSLRRQIHQPPARRTRITNSTHEMIDSCTHSRPAFERRMSKHIHLAIHMRRTHAQYRAPTSHLINARPRLVSERNVEHVIEIAFSWRFIAESID